MERDFKKELKNFESVWQRIEQSKKAAGEKGKQKPVKKKRPDSRFTPGRGL